MLVLYLKKVLWQRALVMNASLVDWQYLVINLHISGPKTLAVVCQIERYRASAASLVQSLEPTWYWNLEEIVIKLKFG